MHARAIVVRPDATIISGNLHAERRRPGPIPPLDDVDRAAVHLDELPGD